MWNGKISTIKLFFGGVILFAVASSFVVFFLKISENKESLRDKTIRDTVVSIKKDPFADITLEAEGAVVFDVRNGKILFSKNHEVQLPLASLTKLMTALIAREKLHSDTVIIIGKDAIEREGDSGFLAGEKWWLKDLIDLTLLASSNDGARAIADAVVSEHPLNQPQREEKNFAGMMNKKALELGLAQTFFMNESGLDPNKGVSGAYGSAYDMARLLGYIVRNYPDLLGATQYAERDVVSLDGKHHHVQNTNEYVERIPGIFSSKTGFTDLAGGNLAIVFEAGPGYPIAISVLSSSREGRFIDAEKLVWATLESF